MLLGLSLQHNWEQDLEQFSWNYIFMQFLRTTPSHWNNIENAILIDSSYCLPDFRLIPIVSNMSDILTPQSKNVKKSNQRNSNFKIFFLWLQPCKWDYNRPKIKWHSHIQMARTKFNAFINIPWLSLINVISAYFTTSVFS